MQKAWGASRICPRGLTSFGDQISATNFLQHLGLNEKQLPLLPQGLNRPLWHVRWAGQVGSGGLLMIFGVLSF